MARRNPAIRRSDRGGRNGGLRSRIVRSTSFRVSRAYRLCGVFRKVNCNSNLDPLKRAISKNRWSTRRRSSGRGRGRSGRNLLRNSKVIKGCRSRAQGSSGRRRYRRVGRPWVANQGRAVSWPYRGSASYRSRRTNCPMEGRLNRGRDRLTCEDRVSLFSNSRFFFARGVGD